MASPGRPLKTSQVKEVSGRWQVKVDVDGRPDGAEVAIWKQETSSRSLPGPRLKESEATVAPLSSCQNTSKRCLFPRG